MKFIKKLLIVMLFSAAVTAIAAAQEENVFNKYDNALGGFYGIVSGSGLSYQHWFDRVGVQTALGLVYYPEEAGLYETSYNTNPVSVDSFTYNIGAEIQYMLFDDSYGDWFDGCLYLFAGGAHTGAVRTVYYYEKVTIPASGSDPAYDTFPTTGDSGLAYIPGMAAGFGFGFELVFFDHFSIPVEIGLAGAWELGSWIPVDAGLKFQGGFRYRF